MCYAGGPRCSPHAKVALDRAMASGDQSKIMKAISDYRLTPRGIAETRVHNPEFADQLQQERDEMLRNKNITEVDVEYSDTHISDTEDDNDGYPEPEMAESAEALYSHMGFDPDSEKDVDELIEWAEEHDYLALQETTSFKHNGVGIDPAGCGCTDCIVGDSINVDDADKMKMLMYETYVNKRPVFWRS